MVNVIQGKDEAVQSMKLLGQDKKEANMFQPDTPVGIFNMQIPSDWADRYNTTPTTEPKGLNETSSIPTLTATVVSTDGDGTETDSTS
jgi:hypothetical protein